MWALVGTHGAWDVFATSVRDGVVLWWVVFGDFDALVSGLGAMVGGGELWCGCNRSKSRVVGALVIVFVNVVVLLARGVWCFTARAQILSLLGGFEFQFLCHGFEIGETEVESCEH